MFGAAASRLSGSGCTTAASYCAGGSGSARGVIVNYSQRSAALPRGPPTQRRWSTPSSSREQGQGSHRPQHHRQQQPQQPQPRSYQNQRQDPSFSATEQRRPRGPPVASFLDIDDDVQPGTRRSAPLSPADVEGDDDASGAPGATAGDKGSADKRGLARRAGHQREKDRYRRDRFIGNNGQPGGNSALTAQGSTGGGSSGKGNKGQTRTAVSAAVSAMEQARAKKAADDLLKKQIRKKKKTEVFLPSYLTVSNLARILGIKLWDLQVRMRNMGHTDLRPDLTLSFTDAELIAAEFDLLAIANDEAAFDVYPRPPLFATAAATTTTSEDTAQTTLPLRPPIVTIMGHVDHGKTTLLDKLRSTSVAAGEAGGITQHIGAFSVPVATSSSSSPQFVTFLDTPGHAAFTAMRSRGASVTDIVVLVVAADDGIMPQTREVIELWRDLSAREAQFDPTASLSSAESSAQAAAAGPGGRRLGSGSVQLVVALSKTDKPTADPERVKRQLLSEGIELEEYGGEVPCVPVSGKTGEGLDLLQDTLATLAELAELRAEPDGPVEGYVIESKVEKGRGNVATVLVKRGCLRVGDVGVAGTTWCKVRSMTDSAGQALRELKPGQAGVVTGWKDLPHAGDEILGAADGGENAAKRAVENRKRRLEAAKLGEDVAQINEQRRLLAEEAEKKKRAEMMERQQRRLSEAALAAGKSVEELVAEAKVAARAGRAAAAASGEDGPGKAVVDEKEAALGEEGRAATAAEAEKKELLVIVKADVSGSVEAVIGAISGIGNKEAGVRIVSSGVGEPTEGDLAMARAVGARIICFNVSIPRALERSASSFSPPIQLHASPIIYRLMEYVSTSVSSLLPALRQIRITGEATIAQVFKINVRSRIFTNIAGCRVTNGTIARSSEVRILRAVSKAEADEDDDGKEDEDDGDESAGLKVGSRVGGGRKVVWVGKLDSLKHGKNEVPERGKGTECGMSFDGFQGFAEGDTVQCFYTVEKPRQLM